MSTRARCLALLAVAGCGRIDFDAGGDGGLGSDDGGLPLQCTTEMFAAGFPPGWTPWSDTTGFTATVVNGEVVIELVPNTNGYAGVNTDTRYDLTDAIVTVAVNAVLTTPSAEQWFTIYIDANNAYDFRFENGLLYMARRAGGVVTATNILYSATAHRSWRMAHDSNTSLVTFSTSDGSTWTERYQVDSTVPVTALEIEVSAGEYGGGGAQPGTARFDNFELCRP